MGLIGHLSKCSVAFTMYIYVHYNYKANEIIFIIHGVYSKKNFRLNFFFENCCITYDDITEQILSTKEIISRNETTLPYIKLSSAMTPEPLTQEP